MSLPQPSLDAALALASLAVHADELLNDEGVTTTAAGEMDAEAIRALLINPHLQGYLAALEPLALLPVKRDHKGGTV